MSRLCEADPDQLVVTAAAFTLVLSRMFDNDELNVLAGLVTTVGDMLALITARRACASPAESGGAIQTTGSGNTGSGNTESGNAEDEPPQKSS